MRPRGGPAADREEAGRLVNDEELKSARRQRRANGIVFLDEIDKITSRGDVRRPRRLRQGVQRDLLPLVKAHVSTRYGMVEDTTFCHRSGAFHLARPSTIPELRALSRSALARLASVEDFERILVSTDASQVKQYQALLETRG